MKFIKIDEIPNNHVLAATHDDIENIFNVIRVSMKQRNRNRKVGVFNARYTDEDTHIKVNMTVIRIIRGDDVVPTYRVIFEFSNSNIESTVFLVRNSDGIFMTFKEYHRGKYNDVDADIIGHGDIVCVKSNNINIDITDFICMLNEKIYEMDTMYLLKGMK